tara:strand:+ start:551 stop:874 length:324 start_codon:yes stop_codon:yes gene_type:complete
MFVPSEGVEHRRLGEKNRNVKLTRKATHEGERLKSHQEQFATLRTKLLLLESEAMFTTEATRALREKQKSLLGNMRYADAFDNMKVRYLESVPERSTFSFFLQCSLQ